LLLTCNVYICDPDGYARPKVVISVHAGGIATWGDLLSAVKDQAPTFSYSGVRLHCWVIPAALTPIIAVAGAALGGYQIHQDIGLTALKGVTPGTGIFRIFGAGTVVGLLFYTPRDDYPFMTNDFYEGVVSTTVASGPSGGRTISVMQQLAMRVCYMITIGECQLRKSSSPLYSELPSDRGVQSLGAAGMPHLHAAVNMLLNDDYIQQCKLYRQNAAMVHAITMYISRACHPCLRRVDNVYGPYTTFSMVLQVIPEGILPRTSLRAWLVPGARGGAPDRMLETLYMSLACDTVRCQRMGIPEIVGCLTDDTPIKHWLGITPSSVTLLVYVPCGEVMLFDTSKYQQTASSTEVHLEMGSSIKVSDAEDISRFLLWRDTEALMRSKKGSLNWAYVTCAQLTRQKDLDRRFYKVNTKQLAAMSTAVEVHSATFALRRRVAGVQKASIQVIVTTGDCFYFDRYLLETYLEDSIDRYIPGSAVSPRCWLVPPSMSDTALSICMRYVEDKRPIGLIELLDFDAEQPLSRWLARPDLDYIFIVQVSTGSEIAFESPSYEDIAGGARVGETAYSVLDLEQSMRVSAYEQSTAWLEWPTSRGMLVEDACMLDEPVGTLDRLPPSMTGYTFSEIVRSTRSKDISLI
jgi:hypothetical protein